MSQTITWAMALPSVANMRLHWAKRAKLVKAQRTRTALALRELGAHYILNARHGDYQFRIILARMFPRKLDSDNLASAFKSVRDEVAKKLGIDDGSDRIEWVYSQGRGPGVVAVTIEMFEGSNV